MLNSPIFVDDISSRADSNTSRTGMRSILLFKKRTLRSGAREISDEIMTYASNVCLLLVFHVSRGKFTMNLYLFTRKT